MTLEVLDSLTGSGALGALDAAELANARQLLSIARRLPAKERKMLATALDKCGPPPAELGQLEGWWSDVKKKAKKALAKVGAAKILAMATAGIPIIGPLVAPLALKALDAAGKAAKGDKAGAAKVQDEIRQAAQAGAEAVQTVAPLPPLPGTVPSKPVPWILIGGAAVAALVAFKMFNK